MWERTSFPMMGILAAMVPFMFGVLGVIVANFPVSLLGGNVPAPLFAIMPVYFWCLVRPDIMPPVAAFGLGILEDIFSGGPPGVWAVAFLVCYALVDRQRDSFAGLSGIAAILGFAAAMVVCALTAYVVASIVYGHLLPATPLIIQITVTVAFYVPGAALMGFVHRRFVGPLRSDF